MDLDSNVFGKPLAKTARGGASNYHHIKCQCLIADMGADQMLKLSGESELGLNFCQGVCLLTCNEYCHFY